MTKKLKLYFFFSNSFFQCTAIQFNKDILNTEYLQGPVLGIEDIENKVTNLHFLYSGSLKTNTLVY